MNSKQALSIVLLCTVSGQMWAMKSGRSFINRIQIGRTIKPASMKKSLISTVQSSSTKNKNIENKSLAFVGGICLAGSSVAFIFTKIAKEKEEQSKRLQWKQEYQKELDALNIVVESEK
jgi:hypothetical protein